MQSANMQLDTIEGYRLSPQQEHLWRLQQADQNFPYRIQCEVRIEGNLNLRFLNEALLGVIARHEILRTTFHTFDGVSTPLQAINDDASARISFTDLSEMNGNAQADRVRRQIEKDRCLPFDLARGPLAHLSLLKLKANRHSLLITVMALCADGRAIENFVRELAESYAGRQQGATIDSETMQYVVFTEWQNELLASDDAEVGREFWRDLNLFSSPELRRSFETAPETSHDFVPRVLQTRGRPEMAKNIEEICARYCTHPKIFLLACWIILAHRVMGEDELLVAACCDGRSDDELERAIGHFSRYLPLPTEISPGLRFDQLLEAVEAAYRTAYEWQDCFTWDVTGEPGRGSMGEPFWNLGFDFEKPSAHIPAGDLSFTITGKYACTDRFKIKLSVALRDGRLFTDLYYDSNAFRPEYIEQLAGLYHRLVESAVDDPEAAVDKLKLLSDEERKRLLVEFNRPAVNYGRDRRIHKLFEEQVDRTPDNIAVEFEGLNLTYAELNRQANSLAYDLRSLGVGPESKVAICLERSIEMVVGLLGILKAGGAYLPLEASYPAERIDLILADAKPAALLTAGRLADRLRDSSSRRGAPLVIIDEEPEWSGDDRLQNPDAGVTADNLAYIIYTSGSTGTPKGVMISHGSICNRLLWTLHAYPLTDDDSLLQKTVFTFDASVWELFAPLFVGARLVMARPEGHRDSAYLASVIAEQQATILQLVPSMLQVMLEEPAFKKCKSLSRVFCGGEELLVKTGERFFATLSADLINLYGPTEVSIDAASWHCLRDGNLDNAQKGAPIGRPLSNVRIYILDAHLEPTPVGTPGELYVGGIGLARGYLNRPDLTIEKFIPNPFTSSAGERLYRTGDLARYRFDGAIEYLGRADHQVKIRGYRIELGEVEAALRRHPSVRDAVAVVREDEPGQQRLVTYVTGARPQSRWDSANGRPWYRLPNQLEIAHLNKNETDILYREVFEDEFYLRHDIRLNDDAIVFDVGANIGLFSLFILDRCPGARIFAFEPIPVTYEALARNLSRYGSASKAYQCGLSDRTGSAAFTFYPKVSASSGMYADAREDEGVTRAFIGNQGEEMMKYADELMEGRFEGVKYECRLRTISEIIRDERVERIDLLKVDVEKSELDVLRGIEEPDWSKIGQLVLEVHNKNGKLQEIVSLLEARGFQLVVEQYLAFENTGLYNVYAARPSKPVDVVAAQAANGAGKLPRESAQNGLSAPQLRQFLGGKLPEYMLPAAIVVLDEFPLLPNGKVNRSALPPVEIDSAPESSTAAFWTQTEELVAGLWCNVLGTRQIGLYDNFFDLGGHSLLATQAISRLREVFQIEIPLRSIFEFPTVMALAGRIDASRMGQQGLQSPPIQPRSRSEESPLSFAQHRLWFFHQVEPDSIYYNIPTVLRLTGSVRRDILERCLHEIVRRHESLRTAFGEVNGEPVQLISALRPQDLEVVDLSSMAEPEREREAMRLAETEARAPFDLTRGPLLRARLLRLSAEEHVLLFTMHHIVSDGWSMGVLMREVSSLYEAYMQEKSSPLADLPIQYPDYAVWQRETMQGEFLEAQLRYWKQQLGGRLPLLNLSVDRPRPEVQSYSGARKSVALSASLTTALKALSRDEGVTLFMTLLASFKSLLHHYSGQSDIIVGTDAANRNRTETEGLIGFFINQLVLRTDLSGDPTFKELLRRVRAVTLGAYDHGDLPFDKLVDALKPDRDLSRAPLFQIKLALQNAPAGELKLPGLVLRPLELEENKSNLDMTLFVRESEQGLMATLEYNTDLFDAAAITQMLAQFESLLDAVATAPDSRLSEVCEILRRNEQVNQCSGKARIEENSFKKFKSIKPKTILMPQEKLVSLRPFSDGGTLPLLVEPHRPEVDLIEWVKENREFIDAKLLEHRGILFRGFRVSLLTEFSRFARTVCSGLFNENGEHPREPVAGDVYTPIFYPPDQQLLWHNENSFNHSWPGKILFSCVRPADRGGETPVVDSQKVYERLDPHIRERFAEKGIMYVRNYGTGLGLGWQTVFQAKTKAEAEAKCREARLEFEWKEGDRLLTRSVRPAVVRHPKSGEMVWFNQAQHWHVSCLDPQTRESIAKVFREEDYPRNCYYGDGSPIEDFVMREILDAYREMQVIFPWHEGDILLLDNLLAAHGREPFTGERKLLVAMGEMLSYEQVESPMKPPSSRSGG
jgi:amino acid adenylation domain-containing protein/FkbM family methyltransferase